MSVMVSPLAVPKAVETQRPRSPVGAFFANYWVRRVIKAVITIYFVATLTFFLVRLMPGNPVEAFILNLVQSQGIPFQQAQQLAASLFSFNVNEPLWQQYFTYIGNLLHGDLGMSIASTGTPVGRMILQFLPWTLFSVGIALLISFILGVALGMLMAYNRNSLVDNVLSVIGAFFSSVPNYLVAILIVVFLGIRLHLVPFTAMRGSLSPGIQPGLNLRFIGDAFFHASLPIAVYVLTTVGSWMLRMKSSTTDTLGEDYVTVARARGLRSRRIVGAYVGRNAMLPLVSVLAISLGYVIGGSILIENIFVYQGIGWILGTSINARDYTVMQGIFLIITIAVVVSNLLADIVYGALDPRVRIAEGS
jgi:peptide/nickel transport system permease protein